MRRRQDWPMRLQQAIDAARTRPFAWGVHDCALAAAGMVEAMTGQDLAWEHRATYHDRLGAAKLVAAAGGLEPFIAGVCERAGLSGVPVLMAQRGDVVLREHEEGGAMVGVVDLSGKRAVFPGPDGLVTHPLRSCRRAWRV